MNTYLCIDPGLKNTAAVLVKVYTNASGCTRAYVHDKWVGDLSGTPNPCRSRAREFFTGISDHIMEAVQADSENLAPTVLVEFQAPLNTRSNPSLVCWNGWIEAYAVVHFERVPMEVEYIHPNAVKWHFNIDSGVYHTNKALAVTAARTFVDNPESVDSDHVADSVLMGLYHFQRDVLPRAPRKRNRESRA
eukprot:m51a1_g13460 hypothetical protein (191) ;mRNA; r:710-1282